VLKEPGWAVLMSKKRSIPVASIVHGEARGLTAAVKHVCRSMKNFGCRRLLMLDSSACVLALCKGRPSAVGACAALRSVAAHDLATGAVFAGRWFPREWNRADGPSRGLRHSGYGGGDAAAEDPRGAAQAGRGVSRDPRGPARDALLLRSAARQLKAARRAQRLPILARERYLQARSARTEAVRRRYSEFLEELDQWLEVNGLLPRPCPSGRLAAGTVGRFDHDVSDWMNEQYMEGFDHWRGANVLAAIAWADSRLGRAGSHGPPQSRQALKGWRNLTPAASRLPLSVEVVFAIAMELLAMGRWGMATCAMLSLAFLMSLVLHPLEDETSLHSKTGEFDESFLLDLDEDQCLGPLCQRLIQSRDPQEPLFAFSQAEFARCFKRAGARLMLQRPPPPRILRHSGASRDFAEQRRTLVGVKRRGRWRTDASARRYEKGGRLGSEFAKLPARLQTHARWCLKYLPAALSGLRVFLEVFAGTARLGRAMAVQGVHALARDAKCGEQCDLTSPSKSSDRAMGLDGPSAKDLAKVDLGNCAMSFTVSCLHACRRMWISGAMENPATS
ncbi:unnamed protein product, partial [Prorocentrum cordatum]